MMRRGEKYSSPRLLVDCSFSYLPSVSSAAWAEARQDFSSPAARCLAASSRISKTFVLVSSAAFEVWIAVSSLVIAAAQLPSARAGVANDAIAMVDASRSFFIIIPRLKLVVLSWPFGRYHHHVTVTVAYKPVRCVGFKRDQRVSRGGFRASVPCLSILMTKCRTWVQGRVKS